MKSLCIPLKKIMVLTRHKAVMASQVLRPGFFFDEMHGKELVLEEAFLDGAEFSLFSSILSLSMPGNGY